MENEKVKTSRASQTRAKTAKKVVWTPPSSLDAPPAPDGFRHRWIRAESMGFDDSKNSQDLFSEILLTKRSDDRKRKLSRRLSKTLIGDLRSRDDLDAFFFSVSLKEARNLKPALDFLSENKFDLYLLNSWEKEDNYLLRDKDLIGSVNADIPVMMPIELPDFLTESSRNRSFAIGYDSYELALILSTNKENNINFTGMTGRFSSSPRGKLSRKSLKVKVQGGKIKNLNF